MVTQPSTMDQNTADKRSEADVLLQMAAQIADIAESLRGGNVSGDGHGSECRFFFGRTRYDPDNGHSVVNTDNLIRKTRPPLPDPRLVRRMIRQRRLRSSYLEGELFADPAWDMLLDLAAARAEHKRVSVTSLCIASAVPPTTALRWINQLTAAGLLQRLEDETDRRRAFVVLTDKAADAIARYFVALDNPRLNPI